MVPKFTFINRKFWRTMVKLRTFSRHFCFFASFITNLLCLPNPASLRFNHIYFEIFISTHTLHHYTTP